MQQVNLKRIRPDICEFLSYYTNDWVQALQLTQKKKKTRIWTATNNQTCQFKKLFMIGEFHQIGCMHFHPQQKILANIMIIDQNLIQKPDYTISK